MYRRLQCASSAASTGSKRRPPRGGRWIWSSAPKHLGLLNGSPVAPPLSLSLDRGKRPSLTVLLLYTMTLSGKLYLPTRTSSSLLQSPGLSIRHPPAIAIHPYPHPFHNCPYPISKPQNHPIQTFLSSFLPYFTQAYTSYLPAQLLMSSEL